jgi:hypothetical protein
MKQQLTQQGIPPGIGLDRRGKAVMYALAIMTLALGVGFIAYSFTAGTKLHELRVENEKLELEVQQLTQEAEQLSEQLQQAGQDKIELTKKIQELEDKLGYYKVRLNESIRAGQLSEEKRKKFEGIAMQFEYYKESYRTEVLRLRAELQSKEAEIKEKTEKLAVASIENEKKEAAINQLSQNLKAGARLSADEIEFEGIRPNGKIDVGPEFRTRKLEKLKIKARIMRNTVAEAGNRVVFAVVTSPSGKSYPAQMTGRPNFESENGTRIFAGKKSIEYANRHLPVEIVFSPAESFEYERGTHRVELYIQDGDEKAYAAGFGEFVIR